MYEDCVIVIPSRLGSVRLSEKPIQDINGKTMISRVVHLAKQTKIKNVIVATDSDKIRDSVVQDHPDVVVIMTDPELQSGTDRVHQAIVNYTKEFNKSFKYVINLQGDMPNISPDMWSC